MLLLVRGRGKLTARQRVAKLLSGPLFHLLHEQTIDDAASNVFSKVCVLEGDLEAPGLGLSEGDRQLVLAETDILIHCAADLALEPHIQRTLRWAWLLFLLGPLGDGAHVLKLAASGPPCYRVQ